MQLCCMLLNHYTHLNGLAHTDLAHHELESNFVVVIIVIINDDIII